MTSTYTAESMHRLLSALLGPTWMERREADSMLDALKIGVADREAPAILGLLDEGTDLFGAHADTFLRELTTFWMNTLAQAHAERARGRARRGDGNGLPWTLAPSSGEFPLSDVAYLSPFEVYGMGVGWYLTTQARRLGGDVDAYVQGLAHPSWTVTAACWQILGKTPDRVRSAIAPMLDSAFRRPYSRPDPSVPALVAILDAHASAKHMLVDALAVPAGDRRAEVVAALAEGMAVVPPELFAAMVSSLDVLEDAEQRFAIVKALSALAQDGRGGPADVVLRRAEAMVRSPEPADRGGGAWGLARLGTPAAHEPRLLALLKDPHWMPRCDAAAAVAQWPQPSSALVLAVADLLGDYEEHDGEPHNSALGALCVWGPRSAPAVGKLAAWLVDPEESPSPETVWHVIEALGPAADGLRAAVRQVVAAYERADAEALPDRERAIEVPGQLDVGPAASLAEEAAEPSAIDHLQRWLREGEPS